MEIIDFMMSLVAFGVITYYTFEVCLLAWRQYGKDRMYSDKQLKVIASLAIFVELVSFVAFFLR